MRIRSLPRRHSPCRGFTLIELILVVTILGILAVIVVPRVSTSSATSKDKVQAHHTAQLNSLVEQYFLDTGGWPTALSDLVPTQLPDGVPADPHGGTFTLNTTTHRVEVTP